MIVSVPKEIVADERRVGLLPLGAQALSEAGQTVYVQEAAGVGAGVAEAVGIEFHPLPHDILRIK